MNINAIDFPEFAGEGDPHEALQMFLNAVNALLESLITSNDDGLGNKVFDERFHDDLTRAWAEAREHFGSASRVIAQVPNEDLHRHGLGGFQLRLKLSVIRFHFYNFLKRGKEALRAALDPIDVVLNSVAVVVPPVEAITEMKDILKSCIR
jgi:hypothetical protein